MQKLKGKPLIPSHLKTDLADRTKVITCVTVALVICILYHSYWKQKKIFPVMTCGPYLGSVSAERLLPGLSAVVASFCVMK